MFVKLFSINVSFVQIINVILVPEIDLFNCSFLVFPCEGKQGSRLWSDKHCQLTWPLDSR